jgi:hypothetical protein
MASTDQQHPVTQLIFSILMRQMPLYENINARKVVYWLSHTGVRLCGMKTDKLALLTFTL